MSSIDADLARMLADLGGSRRDHISAPAADNKGNLIRIDEREEAALVEQDRERRRRLQATAHLGGEAALLSAWNCMSDKQKLTHASS